MALDIILGTVIQQLVTVIEQQTEAGFRFESILNNIKSTLQSAYPKIGEICRLRESNDLHTDELQRLSEHMNLAMQTIDKYSRVTCWNYFKKRKYRNELLRIDASLRNFFLVNLPIDQYKNTTLIQVRLRQLMRRKSNGSRRVLYMISGAASEILTNFVRSLRSWMLLYLRSVMRITRWGYQRVNNVM
ncbi:hypothetical protein GQ457_05G006920 [Hibiscus cannabinus]